MQRRMILLSVSLILALALTFTSASAASPLGSAILFEGKIRTTFTGSCDMIFSLWDASSAGSQVGSDIPRSRVQVTIGSFSTLLDFGSGAFNGEARWVETRALCPSRLIGTYINYGRTRLEAVPYAQYALNSIGSANADLLDGHHGAYYLDAGNIDTGTLGAAFYSAYSDLAAEGYLGDAEGDLALNNGNLQSSLNADMLDGMHASSLWLLGGNTLAGEGVLGLTNNNALIFIVNNQRGLRLEPNILGVTFIGGNRQNSVTNGAYSATIGGGGNDGQPNLVTDLGGTVAGGSWNRAGDASGSSSDRTYATVSGGFRNAATGSASVVGGGDTNSANGTYATVSGGYWNSANGNFSTVVGGSNNLAISSFATILGGSGNYASGDYSLAARRNAFANHTGSFVWSDSIGSNFNSTNANQFAVRATGGVLFNTGGNPFTINGFNAWHAGNDGSGSGLDADTLDGKHSSEYQLRVTGTCAVGSFITAVNTDGTVTCSVPASPALGVSETVQAIGSSWTDFTSTSITINTPSNGMLIVEGTVRVILDHTDGTLDTLNLRFGMDGNGDTQPFSWDIPSAYPTSSSTHTFTFRKVYTAVPGGTHLIKLQSRMASGWDAGDSIQYVELSAVFYPAP